MFMSRFEINTRRRCSREFLASPHKLHAAIVKSFPREVDPGRVLWRLDAGRDRRQDLLVVSAQRPDFTALVEDCGWPTSDTRWRTTAYDRFLDDLAPGQLWQFRLVANPVSSVHMPGTRGKPVPLTREQQYSWLPRQADRHGFSVTTDGSRSEISRRETWRFTKERGQRTVTLGTAQFDGVLRVEDAQRLHQAMVRGIGRAKAYGCGLLTLRRT